MKLRKCNVCGKRHYPVCDEEEYEEDAGCLECGTEAEALFEHPELSEDRLCKDCLLSWWESRKEELESEMESAEEEISKLKGTPNE